MSYETDLIDAMPRCRHGMAPALCTLCPYERGYRDGIEAAARWLDAGWPEHKILADALRLKMAEGSLAAAPDAPDATTAKEEP